MRLDVQCSQYVCVNLPYSLRWTHDNSGYQHLWWCKRNGIDHPHPGTHNLYSEFRVHILFPGIHKIHDIFDLSSYHALIELNPTTTKSHAQTWVCGSTNWTPRYEINMLTARLVFLWECFVSDAVFALAVPNVCSFRFSFSMDLRVDSVPRSSLTIVDPRYWRDITPFDRMQRESMYIPFDIDIQVVSFLFTTYIHFIFHGVCY